MNKFGPLVVRYLSQELGVRGDVTRSVMTSHMADAARERYLPDGMLHETAVGFQYLKRFIPQSVNSWEESDGMSPKGWSRDKDGLVAALILTAMVLHYDRTVERLLADAERELGTYFFERRKVAVAKSGDDLSRALDGRFRELVPGSVVRIADRDFRVARQLTLDGTKIVFENGWWLGARPSGTEPVVRPYVETFAAPDASADGRDDARVWQGKIVDWLAGEITALVG
jgi:phosphomannomutase